MQLLGGRFPGEASYQSGVAKAAQKALALAAALENRGQRRALKHFEKSRPGIQAAFTFAVIGAIVGEFVGAQEGLGYLLNLYNFQLRIDRAFAVIVILASVGAAGFFLLEWADRKFIFWREERSK